MIKVLPLLVCAVILSQETKWITNEEEAKTAAKKQLLPLLKFSFVAPEPVPGANFEMVCAWDQGFKAINDVITDESYASRNDLVALASWTTAKYYMLGNKVAIAWFYDPFGYLLKKYEIKSKNQFENCRKDFFTVYKDVKPRWIGKSVQDVVEDYLPEKENTPSKFLIIYAFLDDSDLSRDIESFLSDKLFTRFRHRLLLVKKNYKHGGKEEGKWDIKNAGTFILLKIVSDKEKIHIIKNFSKVPDPASFYTLLEQSVEAIDSEIKVSAGIK